MKTQDRAFHKNWQKNIQKNDGNNIIKRNVYKTILKIVLLLLIICTVIVVYKWGNKIPDVEILNINQEQSIYQPDTLLSPKLLIKNKSNEPITIEALKAKKDIEDSNIIILESSISFFAFNASIVIGSLDLFFIKSLGLNKVSG